jgi:hypothetical protein
MRSCAHLWILAGWSRTVQKPSMPSDCGHCWSACPTLTEMRWSPWPVPASTGWQWRRARRFTLHALRALTSSTWRPGTPPTNSVSSRGSVTISPPTQRHLARHCSRSGATRSSKPCCPKAWRRSRRTRSRTGTSSLPNWRGPGAAATRSNGKKTHPASAVLVSPSRTAGWYVMRSAARCR